MSFPRVSRAWTVREPQTHLAALWGNEKPIASPVHPTKLRCEHSTCTQHAFAPAPCKASHGCDARNDDPLTSGDGALAAASAARARDD